MFNYSYNHVLFVFLLIQVSLSTATTTSYIPSIYTPTDDQKDRLKQDVKDMFYHSYDGYLNNAFPMDELKPISCSGSNTFGEYALTFIDSLDTLALMGNMSEFKRGVDWIIDHTNFDTNKTVSVFETNIRVLGGLLSSHLLAEILLKPTYKGELLDKALDLGNRLLPAFDTPTGIPYGAVNLKYGVPINETTITCTAAAGTFSLEFGILSKLTGKSEFEKAARKSIKSIWEFRSELDLLGNHIDIVDGEWTIKESGIGTGIDSFFEYLFKSAIYFDDQEYMDIFLASYKAIIKHVKKESWYVDVSLNKGAIIWPIYNSLQSFWPGLQSMFGQVEDAMGTIKAFHSVWRRYGFTPEGYNLISGQVQHGQKGYPLRPELVESLYYLYQTNKDPLFVKMAKDMVWTLNNVTKVECGHANIKDVESHSLDDKMESFFLSETCKYLYLLFSTTSTIQDNNNVGDSDDSDDGDWFKKLNIIFNTEGHIFPMQYRFFEKSTDSSNNINSKEKENADKENIQQQQQQVGDSKKVKEFEWICKPMPYLRTISSGPFQFIGGYQETEWYEDKKILDAIAEFK